MYFACGCVIWNEGGQGTNKPKNGGVASKKIALEKKTKITIGPLYRTMCCNEKYNIIFTLYNREVKNNSVAEVIL